ncbi:MAG: O-antigen ligase family protein [Clostridium argentinense]|uniref:O-antigen ligase family protein n=1 Tax=Clostridium faecium TaxID=2762223 RepID=A0ABR8YV00_9CLOT|nr:MULTISPECIES: O-antigen ligase family protein [Clostridium]MBD8048019.1 O-antigen ligase family protein [Clostridium faecium]MBS5822610.1 O-antigen ligase family protein [Clostridium argentinense]
MDIKKLINKYYKLGLISLVLSIVLALPIMNIYGKKDAIMFVASAFFLVLEILLLFKDKRISLMLFILSFPILVIARKFCYFDFFIFKITFETIYISIAFVLSFKDIKIKVSQLLKDSKSANFKFVLYTIIFLILAINSNIFSHNVLNSITNVYIGVVIPIAFILVMLVNISKDDKYYIYYALIAGLDFSSLYGIAQMRGVSFSQIKYYRLYLTFGYHNVNIFSAILILILPLLIEMILYKKNTIKEKIFLFISFGLFSLSTYMTYSRGAWLCYLISIGIIVISKKYKYIALLELVAIPIAFKPVMSKILTRGYATTSFFMSQSTMARIQSYFTSLMMMIAHPFGIGGGNYGDMYLKYAEKGYLHMPDLMRANLQVADYALEHAHNLFVQIGVEYGIITMILFIIMIINRLTVVVKDYKNNRGIFAAIIVFTIISILTGGEFNHKGVITPTLILWLLFGITILNSTKEEENIDNLNRKN